ncbi:hypothetical protein BJF79_03845 [Actinomadura sp. CNU-125]|uniref:hypothetical protein n=1 Tax=Actinomadura sp. CNU-125 TaxID=1904961 RepID=UPI00095CDC51|nr:hypothetical protein [Actinomadura sp. CNU-125]OLT13042.1 hypothetical protein BJF79_03845 [Actinomadura sp. CNU-125]
MTAGLMTVLGDRQAWQDLYSSEDAPSRARVEQLAERLQNEVDGEVEQMLHLPFPERKTLLDEAVWELAQGADVLLYAGEENGKQAFAALLRIVAILALQPGGITFLGHHWCVLHRLCRSAIQITVTSGRQV